MITLYELCGADRDLRFSPPVWRIRMMLEHKGLDYVSEPRTFLDKADFAASGSTSFPTIKDGDRWVSDSFDIAVYLDETYPQKPLIGGEMGIDYARFFNNWVMTGVLSRLFPMLAVDIPPLLDADNAAYFRTEREATLGMTLEAAADGRDTRLPDLHKALAPVHMTLKTQPFLGGHMPRWSDYCLFGAFMWSYCVSELDVLEGDAVTAAWFGRMLDLFGGHARAAKTAYPKN